jgi:hypothetical protein
MSEVVRGERILIPISVDRGAFPTESLITVDAKNGPVSGFIRADQIHTRNGNSFIEGVVLNVAEDAITVQLPGSFFTTTGLAYISPGSEFLRAA